MLNVRNRFRVFDLARAGLFGQLLVGFEHLANAGRADRMTVTDQTAACVHWNLERRFGFFLDAPAEASSRRSSQSSTPFPGSARPEKFRRRQFLVMEKQS